MSGDEIPRPAAEDGSRTRRRAARTGRLSADEALWLLGAQRRRTMLRYLMRHPTEPVAVGDLVDRIVAAEASRGSRHRARERIRASVQHIHLPSLTNADLIRYEADTEQVRYQGEPRLEALLECIDDLYPV